ncbi:MAG: CHAT domain-containing protein [Chitinophagaceae bacterium]
MPVNAIDFRTGLITADKLYAEGKLREAATLYRQLLLSRMANVGDMARSFNSYDANVMERLADIEISLEKTDEANLILSALQDLLYANGNVVVGANIVLKRCEIYLADGDLDTSFTTLKIIGQLTGDVTAIKFSQLKAWTQECPISELPPADRNMLYPRLLYVIGRILIGLGQYNDALSALIYGYEKFTLADNIITRALLSSLPVAIAQAHLEMGEIKNAQHWIDKANSNLALVDDHSQQVSCWQLQAKLDLLRGRFGDTLIILQKIYNWYHGRGLFGGTLITILNMAHTKIYLNQHSVAERLLDEAEVLAARTGTGEWNQQIYNLRSLTKQRATSSVPTVSVIPSLITIRRRSRGNIESPQSSAGPEKGKAWYPTDQRTGFLVRFEERAIFFQTILATGQLSDASLELKGLMQVFDATDSVLVKNRLVVLQYLLNYYHQTAINIESLQLSCHYFREQGLLPELWQAQRLLSWNPMAKPLNKKMILENNQQVLEELSRSLPADQQSMFFINKWTAEEEYLNQKILDLSVIGNKLRSRNLLASSWRAFQTFMGITRLLHLIDAHKEKVVRDALRINPGSRGLKDGITLIKSILFHPSRKLSLSFLVLPDRTVVVYRRKFYIGFSTINLNRFELRKWVEQWHLYSAQDLDAIDISSPERRERLGILSTTIARGIGLLDILENTPSHVTQLTIVPDDALCGFPFSSILYKNEYLVQRMAISIKFTSLPIANNTHKSSRLPKALCAFVSKGGTDFAPLPGAEREAIAIQAILKSLYPLREVSLLDDNGTTAANIIREASGSRVLHIACHGKFDHQDPGQSGLILSNGEKLTIRQISVSEAFSAVDHITLSACWSADLFILPGRWIVSLPEVLNFAGAKSILGCYWQINDEIALSFMKAFYTYAAKFPRNIALQKCQLDAIQNNLPDCMEDTSNPLYWSGFSIYGRHADKRLSGANFFGI